MSKFTGDYDFSNIKWFSPVQGSCILKQECLSCNAELSLDLYEAQLEYPKEEGEELYFYCEECKKYTVVTTVIAVKVEVTITDIIGLEDV